MLVKRIFPSLGWPFEPTKAKPQYLMSEREQLEKGGEGGYLKNLKVLQLFWLIFLISVMFQALCLLCGVNSFGSLMSHPAHK